MFLYPVQMFQSFREQDMQRIYLEMEAMTAFKSDSVYVFFLRWYIIMLLIFISSMTNELFFFHVFKYHLYILTGKISL